MIACLIWIWTALFVEMLIFFGRRMAQLFKATANSWKREKSLVMNIGHGIKNLFFLFFECSVLLSELLEQVVFIEWYYLAFWLYVSFHFSSLCFCYRNWLEIQRVNISDFKLVDFFEGAAWEIFIIL